MRKKIYHLKIATRFSFHWNEKIEEHKNYGIMKNSILTNVLSRKMRILNLFRNIEYLKILNNNNNVLI